MASYCCWFVEISRTEGGTNSGSISMDRHWINYYLLKYCHSKPWPVVDRNWTFNTCHSTQSSFVYVHWNNPPRLFLHLIVVRGFEYAKVHESYTSGSVATGRAPLLYRSTGTVLEGTLDLSSDRILTNERTEIIEIGFSLIEMVRRITTAICI